ELAQLSPYAVVLDEQGNAILSPTDRLKMLQRQFVRDSAIYSQDHPDILRLRREIETLSAQTGVSGIDRSILETALDARRQELEAVRERGVTDEHPDVVRLQMAIANLEKALRSAPRTPTRRPPATPPDNPVYLQRQVQLDAARAELDAAIARRDELRRRLESLEERLTRTPEVEREYAALSRGYEQLVAQYGEVLRKQQEAAIAVNLEEQNRGDRFSVVDSPDEPTRPAQPNRIAILLLGMAFAFLGGAAGVAVAETMDSTVRSPRDVQALLEIPPLVMVPYIDNETDLRRRRWKRFAVAASVSAWIGFVALLVMTPPMECVESTQGNDRQGIGAGKGLETARRRDHGDRGDHGPSGKPDSARVPPPNQAQSPHLAQPPRAVGRGRAGELRVQDAAHASAAKDATQRLDDARRHGDVSRRRQDADGDQLEHQHGTGSLDECDSRRPRSAQALDLALSRRLSPSRDRRRAARHRRARARVVQSRDRAPRTPVERASVLELFGALDVPADAPARQSAPSGGGPHRRVRSAAASRDRRHARVQP